MLPSILFFLVLIGHFISLPFLFKKAGIDSWKGLIPIYNVVVWLQIMKKPWWWILILLIPGVNIVLFLAMNYELSRCYGPKEDSFGVLAVVAPFIALPILAFGPDKFIGPEIFTKNNKSKSREWAETRVFAVIAATIIRTFVLEAFTIPTPSMEKSLRVGDFLFVSKLSYGARLPMTPVSFPFAHHTLPLTKSTPSFLDWYNLPYFRLPGISSVKRGDAIVFNFPEGDTVAANMQAASFYELVRQYGRKSVMNNELRTQNNEPAIGDILVRPFDKTDHYIKRCVALPNDKLEIKEGIVYINDTEQEMPEMLQYSYNAFVEGSLNMKMMKTRFDVSESDIRKLGNGFYNIPLTNKDYEEFKKLPFVKSVSRNITPISEKPNGKNPIFPHSNFYNWSEDNFGPITIPAKGVTVKLTKETLPLYKRIIKVYEKNSLEIKGDKFVINGSETDSYTFKQDYYFAMGDNRHRSADSRYWGFVPHELMVGKAVFVWFSKDPETGIRWKRLFSFVN